jgi:hypothetical protein
MCMTVHCEIYTLSITQWGWICNLKIILQTTVYILLCHSFAPCIRYCVKKLYAILFDTFFLMMIPCGLKHVLILSAII